MNEAFVANLFWLSFWLYFLSFALFAVYLAVQKPALGWVATAFMFLGFIPHTAALVNRWILLHELPMNTMYEYANLMSWMVVAVFGFFLLRYRRPLIGVVISPCIVMIMVATSILPRETSAQMVPQLRGSWLTIHVALTALGEAAFAIGFALGLTYLVCARRWKVPSASATAENVALLAMLQDMIFRAIAFGYPFFTVGALFAGSIWALEASGSFWAWNPKEVSALLIWSMYTAYLYARMIQGWRPARLAWMSIAGFTLVLLSLLSNLLFGAHPQG
jgi:cytochrome c-type biogenesis protein CcsB